MGKFSKLARSHNLDFLNVSILSDTVVYSAIPYEKIKAYNYVSEALARAYKLRVYDFFFFFFFFLCRYIWGLAPPPHTKKLATLLLPAFANKKTLNIPFKISYNARTC